jgi:hypothetical protein
MRHAGFPYWSAQVNWVRYISGMKRRSDFKYSAAFAGVFMTVRLAVKCLSGRAADRVEAPDAGWQQCGQSVTDGLTRIQVIYVSLGLYGYYILGTNFDFEQVTSALPPAACAGPEVCTHQHQHVWCELQHTFAVKSEHKLVLCVFCSQSHPSSRWAKALKP